ncbi:NPP1 family protein [Microdochium nivale]|nr:NPP1 family protein [Microdochium nivale]
MHTVTSAVLLSLAASLASTSPTTAVLHHRRDVVSALPGGADEDEARYQPLTDYDTDSCYATSAVDGAGNTNPGLFDEPEEVSPCRDPARLENMNVYSRKRCNNGWCAYMYEYYFERDFWFFGGHMHDWENLVVFVQDGAVKRVAPSCHGKYDDATNEPRMDGDRVKAVYHTDAGTTRCWRISSDGDEPPENFSGSWWLGTLVGYNYWPTVNGQLLREKVWQTWPSGVAPKLWDDGDAFTNNLRAAAGDGAPGFDPAIDG